MRKCFSLGRRIHCSRRGWCFSGCCHTLLQQWLLSQQSFNLFGLAHLRYNENGYPGGRRKMKNEKSLIAWPANTPVSQWLPSQRVQFGAIVTATFATPRRLNPTPAPRQNAGTRKVKMKKKKKRRRRRGPISWLPIRSSRDGAVSADTVTLVSQWLPPQRVQFGAIVTSTFATPRRLWRDCPTPTPQRKREMQGEEK
jgi:hypothetical protein